MTDDIATLLRLGRTARREQRRADAQVLFGQALACARRAGTPLELIEALRGLGQIERDLGRDGECRALLEEAVGFCRSQGDALLLAHTVRHLGEVALHGGHFEQAEQCLSEALAIYRGQGQVDALQLANALRPLALLHEQQGRSTAAVGLWTEARALYSIAAIAAGVAECDAHLPRQTGS